MAFIFDANKGQSPQSVARQREIAARLMGEIGYQPVRNVGEGIGSALASIGAGIGARTMNKRADKAEAEGRAGASSVYDQIVASIMGQGGGNIAPQMDYSPTGSVSRAPLAEPSMTPDQRVSQAFSGEESAWPGAAPKQDRLPQASAGNPAYRDAIASIESAGSGDYSAVGPTHPELGRALGRYQVMEANVGPWTREALGQELTPEQFLASPEAQNAVFDKQFGGYVDQFGSPEAAAQAWFAGPGGVGKTGRQDSLGTTVGEYGQKFAQALGGGQTMTDAAPPQAGGMSIQQLMQAASNPWLNEGQRAGINMLLEQEMKRADPGEQLDMQYRRAQIGKMQRDAATGDENFFGNPVAIENEDGSVSYGQMGNKGTFRPIKLSEGQKFAPPTKKIDAGTEEILVDQAGNVVARIPKNVAGAEAQKVIGKDQGEAAALLESMQSKMPGLEQVVGRLDQLAGEATYTLGGQALDSGMRQMGMEPRDSAVARSEYTAIVDNQILPLLRDTFGAQFTASEGDRLRDTLGDPNKSPKEKQALLRAFIEQKRRDIEALSTRTGETSAPAASGGWQDVGGVKIRRKQ